MGFSSTGVFVQADTTLYAVEWMLVVWSVSPVRDAVCASVPRAGRLNFLFVV